MLDQEHSRRWRFWRGAPGRLDLTGILWPALGYPAVLEADGNEIRFIALLCLPGEPPKPTEIRAALRSDSELRLRVLKVERVPLEAVQGIGRWAPWVMDGAPRVVRLLLSTPCPDLLRRMTLYDLEIECRGRLFRKPGAVAFRKPGRRLRIALATDLHLARRWDEYEEAFARSHSEVDSSESDFATFSPAEAFSRQTVLNSLVNPNRNLGAFIRVVNELAERDEADAVILSGDLVDYKFNRRRGRGGKAFADTGWKLLHDLLLGSTAHAPRLRVPLFTSTGNHDYRLYPYRFRTYGMRHVGIPEEVSERYLRSQGNWGRFKYALHDLDALRIDSGNAHSLDYYFREFNPCLDYQYSLGGVRFLALDSGPDAITNLDHLRTIRRRRFARGLRNIHSPYANGFSDEQVEYLLRWFDESGDRTAVIVSHAPLVFPPAQAAELFTVPDNGDVSAEEFARMLADRRLDRRTVIANQLPVFQALRGHSGPALFFAGHCHTEAELGLDRKTGHVYGRGAAAGARKGGRGQSALFHTPSLGHENPAYRLISVKAGAVEQVTLEPLLTKAADGWAYDWSVEPAPGGVEHVEFSFRRKAAAGDGALHRLVLRFTGARVTNMSASAAGARGLIDSRQELEHPLCPYACWVVRDVPCFRVVLRNRPRGVRVSFLYENIQDGARSGLRWHPKTAGGGRS